MFSGFAESVRRSENERSFGCWQFPIGGDSCFNLGQDKSVGSPSQAIARQALVLYHLDPKRCPVSSTRPETDCVSFVVRIRAARHDQSISRPSMKLERSRAARDIDITVHQFVVVIVRRAPWLETAAKGRWYCHFNRPAWKSAESFSSHAACCALRASVFSSRA